MRIVVLGSGISGLSTAAELLRGRHEVIVVSAEPITATTSFLAAAGWVTAAAGPGARVGGGVVAALGHFAGILLAGYF
ncbi:FAD-dependent oxidoreductase [Nocardia abscessus]|uniref:FAD-dependent oxidoreductase n=1 Tax=Nocardia abscessus TaxID=120957 RepID=UPI002456C590|nr:FAD-dependent oxidoreductase [Nocardia abscessus]